MPGAAFRGAGVSRTCEKDPLNSSIFDPYLPANRFLISVNGEGTVRGFTTPRFRASVKVYERSRENAPDPFINLLTPLHQCLVYPEVGTATKFSKPLPLLPLPRLPENVTATPLLFQKLGQRYPLLRSSATATFCYKRYQNATRNLVFYRPL